MAALTAEGRRVALVRCDAAGCRHDAAFDVAGTGEPVGIAIDRTDLVMIRRVSQDNQSSELTVTRCPIASCPAGATIAPIAKGRFGWRRVAVGIRDGRPVVAYWHESDGKTVIQSCDDAACTRLGRRVELAGPQRPLSVAFRGDGRPVVLAGTSLVTCNDRTCASSSVVKTADGTGDEVAAAFTIDPAGKPLVVTGDLTGEVRLHTCADSACRTMRAERVGQRDGGTLATLAVAVAADGTPRIAWLADDALIMIACLRAECR
jgi:hypothetical protein